MYGYTSVFSAVLTRGTTFVTFCLIPNTDIALLNYGLLWKERICSKRSEFFPFRVNPFEKGSKYVTDRVTSPDSVSIHLKKNSQDSGQADESVTAFF